jgi:hypothetical protein
MTADPNSAQLSLVGIVGRRFAQNPKNQNMSAPPKPQDEMITIDETAELLNMPPTLLQR